VEEVALAKASHAAEGSHGFELREAQIGSEQGVSQGSELAEDVVI
jgi:hypothetical protein